MTRLFYAAFISGAIPALCATIIDLIKRENNLTPLPPHASGYEIRYQPRHDWLAGSCFPTVAIDGRGHLNQGKNPHGTKESQCRDRAQLDHSNAYSRMDCFIIFGVCSIMYELYYEKEQRIWGSGWFGGHKHAIESVVVFVGMSGADSGRVVKVAFSCGSWGWAVKSSGIQFQDATHPLIIYYFQHWWTGHCQRLATVQEADVVRNKPQNPTANFLAPPLIGWEGWPPGLRDKLTTPGALGKKARLRISDDLFEKEIRTAWATLEFSVSI